MMKHSQVPFLAICLMAWRNLWRNHRRTIIMLAAISIGVWAMIFMTALMRGMVNQMVQDGIHSLPGEIQIHHPLYLDDPSINNSLPPLDKTILAALNQPSITAWSARIRVPAVISSERESRGVTVVGIDPEPELAGSFFSDSLSSGVFLDSANDKGIIIGKSLAEKLETRLGKRVVLMSQDPENEVADRGFRIRGIYESDLEAREQQFVYVGKATLDNMLRMNGMISEIAIDAAGDYRILDDFTRDLNNSLRPDADVKKWQDLDSYLGTMLDVMDGFVLVWVIIVFLALSFGLVNTLAMAVFERIREIGLMLALGMRPGSILLQILMESLYLILIGLLIGNAVAVLSIKPLESGIDISIVAEGMAMMGVGSMLYPALEIKDVLLANVVVVLLGLITSLLPAWRAARLDPIRALNSH